MGTLPDWLVFPYWEHIPWQQGESPSCPEQDDQWAGKQLSLHEDAGTLSVSQHAHVLLWHNPCKTWKILLVPHHHDHRKQPVIIKYTNLMSIILHNQTYMNPYAMRFRLRNSKAFNYHGDVGIMGKQFNIDVLVNSSFCLIVIILTTLWHFFEILLIQW